MDGVPDGVFAMKRFGLSPVVAASLLAILATGCPASSDTPDATTDLAANDPGNSDPAANDLATTDLAANDPGLSDDAPAGDPTVAETTPDAIGEAAQDPGAACDADGGTVQQMGYPCETDCDCGESLFCYAEDYPGAQGVCTRECAGSCGDANVYKCVKFSPVHWNAHNITHQTICMPTCLTLADCAKYGAQYTFCPGKSAWTSWDSTTLAASTCQVQQTE